jgi:hypothetical protein
MARQRIAAIAANAAIVDVVDEQSIDREIAPIEFALPSWILSIARKI